MTPEEQARQDEIAEAEYELNRLLAERDALKAHIVLMARHIKIARSTLDRRRRGIVPRQPLPPLPTLEGVYKPPAPAEEPPEDAASFFARINAGQR